MSSKFGINSKAGANSKAGMCESCGEHQRTLLVAVDNYLTCLVCAIKSNDKKALAKFKR